MTMQKIEKHAGIHHPVQLTGAVAVAMIASLAGRSALLMAFFSGGMPHRVPGDIDFVSIAIVEAGIPVMRRWKASPMYILAGASAFGLIA